MPLLVGPGVTDRELGSPSGGVVRSGVGPEGKGLCLVRNK